MLSQSARSLVIVTIDVEPSAEAQLNEWYRDHIPHRLSLPGYVAAQRFASAEQQHRYLTAYEVTDPEIARKKTDLARDPGAPTPELRATWRSVTRSVWTVVDD